ncbi:MAG TPA: hypothetical protein VFC78_02830 [Tepidisphaeraceae bacterium]|nr:hypothetical protein [Tepidisphaeraceae bacterium]
MPQAFSIVTPVIDKLTRSRRSSRAIWIDAEPCIVGVEPDGAIAVSLDPGGTEYAIVLRGQDKVLACAAASNSRNALNRKYHKPAFFWSDQQGLPQPFIIAYTGDAEAAKKCAAELANYYVASRSESGNSTTDLLEMPMSADVRSLLPCLFAIFGGHASRWVTKIGSHSDYLAPKNKPRTAARAARLDRTEVLVAALAAATILKLSDGDSALLATTLCQLLTP